MSNMDDNMFNYGAEQIKANIYETNEKKLWNPKWFIVLCALFSFLPAAILYSLNYGRLGEKKKRNISLVVSLIAFAAMITISILVGAPYLKSIFYGLNLGTAAYMNQNQRELFKNHIARGGKKASYLIPSLLCIIVTGAIMYLMSFSIKIPADKLMFSGSELYYTENVQKSEVEKLGDYLTKEGFFAESRKSSVKLNKKQDIYEFSLIVDKDKIGNAEFEKTIKGVCEELSREVFNNSKVNVILADDSFKPLKTISK